MSIMEIRIGQENQKAVLAPVLFNCVTRKIAFGGQFTYVSGLQFFQRGKERQKERDGAGERERMCACVCYIINIFFFLDQSYLK